MSVFFPSFQCNVTFRIFDLTESLCPFGRVVPCVCVEGRFVGQSGRPFRVAVLRLCWFVRLVGRRSLGLTPTVFGRADCVTKAARKLQVTITITAAPHRRRRRRRRTSLTDSVTHSAFSIFSLHHTPKPWTAKPEPARPPSPAQPSPAQCSAVQ